MLAQLLWDLHLRLLEVVQEVLEEGVLAIHSRPTRWRWQRCRVVRLDDSCILSVLCRLLLLSFCLLPPGDFGELGWPCSPSFSTSLAWPLVVHLLVERLGMMFCQKGHSLLDGWGHPSSSWANPTAMDKPSCFCPSRTKATMPSRWPGLCHPT